MSSTEVWPHPLPECRFIFDPTEYPEHDVIGAGGDLRPETLINAYRNGAFPMPAYPNDPVANDLGWWSPEFRGVLHPADFKISRSLRKSAKHFRITYDFAFTEVMHLCGDPSRDGYWINQLMIDAYTNLFHLGWAHSVEVWDADDALVGGLYGISIGGFFAGESMFHRTRDASKVALLGLVELLTADGRTDRLIDTQWLTEHLASLGGIEVPRTDYLSTLLPTALEIPLPPHWQQPTTP